MTTASSRERMPAGGSLGEGRAPGAATRLALAGLPVAATAALCSWATLPNIPGWYAGLVKPPLMPPNGAFGPAWTILYVLMACAVWRVLARPADMPGRSVAVAAFLFQLVLNAGWSWAFFGFRNPPLGMAVVVALLAAILVTMALFRRVDAIACWLLAPYLVWVSFATYLNAGILRLNG